METEAGHRVVTRRGGRRVLWVSRGPWTPEHTAIAKSEGVAGIAVGDFQDLAELDRLPGDLEEISLNLSDPPDLRRLERFSSLRHLSLATASRRRLPLEFSCFPLLEEAWLGWQPGFASLFDVAPPFLRDLHLTGQPHADLHHYRVFPGLQSLRFAAGRRLTSISGTPPTLTTLDLYGQASLTDLVFEDGSQLERLEVVACTKIDRLDGLRPLRHLRFLTVEDCRAVDSIRPLRGMRHLECLLAIGNTTIVDGDLSVLDDLAALKVVGVAERRHDSPSAHEVRAKFPDSYPLQK